MVIEHGPLERSYVIGEALAASGVDVHTCRPYLGDPVPVSGAGLSGVVILGGDMSAASDDGFPSRKAELALLVDAVRRRVPVLGVCLGAQLLALAGGGRVYPGAAGLEVGWTPLQLHEAAAEDVLFGGLPPSLCVLNWHSDTFELPAAAVPLASGPVYHNQAFRLGNQAWGLQFHIEVDGYAVDQFIGAFSEEAALAPGGPVRLAAATATAIGELAPARDLILARYAALVAAAGEG